MIGLYDLQSIILSALPLIPEIITFVKLVKNEENKTLCMIIGLLIISNIACILYHSAFKSPENVWDDGMYFLHYVCLAVSHWTFSYEYFKMARVLPYVLIEENIPKKATSCNKVHYWIWFLLNIVSSAAVAVFRPY